MAWGEWMCPVPGPEIELSLERQRRSIAGYDLATARDLLWRLAQLASHQDLIIRGATRRIAELECREALQKSPTPSAQGLLPIVPAAPTAGTPPE